MGNKSQFVMITLNISLIEPMLFIGPASLHVGHPFVMLNTILLETWYFYSFCIQPADNTSRAVAVQCSFSWGLLLTREVQGCSTGKISGEYCPFKVANILVLCYSRQGQSPAAFVMCERRTPAKCLDPIIRTFSGSSRPKKTYDSLDVLVSS